MKKRESLLYKGWLKLILAPSCQKVSSRPMRLLWFGSLSLVFLILRAKKSMRDNYQW